MDLKYTAQLRIPTEMYSYIEMTVEGTTEDIVRAYYEMTQLVKIRPKSAISDAEFGRIGEEYLRTGKVPNGGDKEFDPEQKKVLKLITSVVRERNK